MKFKSSGFVGVGVNLNENPIEFLKYVDIVDGSSGLLVIGLISLDFISLYKIFHWFHWFVGGLIIVDDSW